MDISFKGKLKNANMSPRKLRIVANLIRGRNLEKSFDMLNLLNKKSSRLIFNLLKSVGSNAKKTSVVDYHKLVVDEIYIGDGIRRKKYMPRAQGRASSIITRYSNIFVTIKER